MFFVYKLYSIKIKGNTLWLCYELNENVKYTILIK